MGEPLAQAGRSDARGAATLLALHSLWAQTVQWTLLTEGRLRPAVVLSYVPSGEIKPTREARRKLTSGCDDSLRAIKVCKASAPENPPNVDIDGHIALVPVRERTVEVSYHHPDRHISLLLSYAFEPRQVSQQPGRRASRKHGGGIAVIFLNDTGCCGYNEVGDPQTETMKLRWVEKGHNYTLPIVHDSIGVKMAKTLSEPEWNGEYPFYWHSFVAYQRHQKREPIFTKEHLCLVVVCECQVSTAWD